MREVHMCRVRLASFNQLGVLFGERRDFDRLFDRLCVLRLVVGGWFLGVGSAFSHAGVSDLFDFDVSFDLDGERFGVNRKGVLHSVAMRTNSSI